MTGQERSGFDKRLAAIRTVKPQAVIPADNRYQYDLSHVGIGGVLKINGEVFVVKSTATYTETNDKHTKDKDYVATELVLFSLRTGETRYIEWEIDDELEISFTERKLSTIEVRNRLRDDEGEAFDIDEDIDECVEEGWPVMFDGVEYPYDDDWACRYNSSDGRSFNAYIYEFGSEDVGWLTVEGWEDGDNWDYEVYLSRNISPSEIEVISLGS